MSKIYTKKGDEGMTSTYSGERRPKYDTLFHTHGAIDDLIGKTQWVLHTLININTNKEQEEKQVLFESLKEITEHLFILQTILSTTNKKLFPKNDKRKSFDFNPQVEKMENLIDYLTSKMPKLTTFVIPGGNECNLRSNDSRVQSRLCERLCLQYVNESGEKEYIGEMGGLKFLNRLSDYFFTLQRFVNYLDETIPTDKKEKTIKIKNYF